MTGAFPVFGAALAGVLSLAGTEFGLLGIGILGYTALRTTRRMSAPLICPPEIIINE